MKITLFTAALLCTASALPSLSRPLAVSALAPRASMCYVYSLDGTTTPDSALVTDCTALQDDIPGFFHDTDWTPSSANHFGFDVHHGTCGLSFTYRKSSSDILNTEFRVSPGQAQDFLQNSIDIYADGGKVSSKGAFHCIVGGPVNKMGWGDFTVYNVEEVEGSA
ncbi:hypothetical protein QBC39DRAFT_382876 [Podospora conica]|nr:hypothetical protein QBC39DRAFT_382876 [Schizothecium conicum]